MQNTLIDQSIHNLKFAKNDIEIEASFKEIRSQFKLLDEQQQQMLIQSNSRLLYLIVQPVNDVESVAKIAYAFCWGHQQWAVPQNFLVTLYLLQPLIENGILNDSSECPDLVFLLWGVISFEGKPPIQKDIQLAESCFLRLSASKKNWLASRGSYWLARISLRKGQLGNAIQHLITMHQSGGFTSSQIGLWADVFRYELPNITWNKTDRELLFVEKNVRSSSFWESFISNTKRPDVIERAKMIMLALQTAGLLIQPGINTTKYATYLSNALNCHDWNNLQDFVAETGTTQHRIMVKQTVFPVMLKRLPQSEKLTILLCQWTERNTPLPYFHRASWLNDINSHVAIITDPTLNLDTSIKLGWYLGRNTDEYLPKLQMLINQICRSLSVTEDKLLFFGSSAGGFASLKLSSEYFPESSAIAENPQVYVHKFGAPGNPHVKKIVNLFDDSSLSFSKKIAKHKNYFSVSPYANRKKGKIIYIQNDLDDLHFSSHFMPFSTLNQIEKHKTLDSSFTTGLNTVLIRDTNQYNNSTEAHVAKFADVRFINRILSEI